MPHEPCVWLYSKEDSAQPLVRSPAATMPAPSLAHSPLHGSLPSSSPRPSYFVPDPSKGAAPGVVKDSSDPEIEGKLELLKVGRLGGGWRGWRGGAWKG